MKRNLSYIVIAVLALCFYLVFKSTLLKKDIDTENVNSREKVFHNEKGQISERLIISDDDLKVVFEDFDTTGNLLEKVSFKNGKLDGEVKLYNPSGQVMREGEYRLGRKHGEFVNYDNFGNIETLGYFEDNELKYLKTFDKNGNIKRGYIQISAQQIFLSDSIHLTIKIPFSSFNSPKIGLILCNRRSDSEFDTIAQTSSNGIKHEMSIPYYVYQKIPDFVAHVVEIDSSTNNVGIYGLVELPLQEIDTFYNSIIEPLK